ncbi:hypothetical protein PM082_015597 [Marasmius tenuissimus]|nr:hypothetical protein PM082_015597 [Marasmius tenuissimus]
MVPRPVARLLSLSLLISTALAAGEDIVDTGYARYLGNKTFSNAVAYLGIPYAEPPIGDRRFRAPAPLDTARIAEESSGEVVDATEYPEFCIQGPISVDNLGGAGSEDCLKMNIYAPSGTKKGDKLPVLVYFHGGGYRYGNPRNWPFDHWVQQSPNVVIASVYYRLDALGFLSHPRFDDPANGDSNAGFLDQIEALRWVKANIESFGGNPGQVTINGESAGGGSDQYHLVANEDEKLFHGAIAQSVWRARAPTPEQQEPLFENFAANAGCGTGEFVEKLACLRDVDVDTLTRARNEVYNFDHPYDEFLPVVDGKVIIGHPTSLAEQGEFAKVPLIVGSTSNETAARGSSDNITIALQTSYPGLSNQDIQDILEVAPASDFDSAAQRFQVVTGESLFICARRILGEAYSKVTDTWTYRYNQANPTTGSTTVGHAAENWMMFLGSNTGSNGSVTFTQMNDVENAFAEELIAYWLSFVRSGDPNKFKLSRSPEWPQYTLEMGKERIVLQQEPDNSTADSGSYIEQEPEKESRRCEVVASKSEQQQN